MGLLVRPLRLASIANAWQAAPVHPKDQEPMGLAECAIPHWWVQMDDKEDRSGGTAGPVTDFRRKADAVAVAADIDAADVYIPNVPKPPATMAMLANAVKGAACSQCYAITCLAAASSSHLAHALDAAVRQPLILAK
jgi:hypothetical protein